ncbi:hypothetical protein Landi51_12658 [Colletotrichum acutatum]
MVGGRWGPKPGSDLSVVCSRPRAPMQRGTRTLGWRADWCGWGNAHTPYEDEQRYEQSGRSPSLSRSPSCLAARRILSTEPQLLAPSLIRLLLPPPTGTRQDGERNHLWEVVFNILVASTGRRFDWNLVPDMILAPSRHIQRLQSPKERQPAGRPSTLVKSVSALALVQMSSDSPRIGSTHAAALTNWVPRWALSGAQRSQTSPSSPPVPDFLSVVWGKVA